MEEKNIVSPDELKAEQEAVAEVKDEEIREKIISEFGFDEIDDAEKIDKLVEREKQHHQKLSTAIGQKIKIRTERDELKKQPLKEVPKEQPKEDTQAVIQAAFEKRDLEELALPPELKDEVKLLAKAKGISVKQAAQDSYILFKKKELDDKAAETEASVSRTHRSGTATKKDWSLDSPPDVDMGTKEGRETWDEYIKQMSRKHPSSSM